MRKIKRESKTGVFSLDVYHHLSPLSLSLHRGSAFPDVCCSFDLLLQLKLQPLPSPPPPPLPRPLAATVTRVQGQRPRPHHHHHLRSDLLCHPPTIRKPLLAARPGLRVSLSDAHRADDRSPDSPAALPQQPPDTPQGPRSI